MQKDKNKIDEIFREGLSDAKFDFDESHWEGIEYRLNNRSGGKRKRIIVLLSSAAAIAAILTLFLIWDHDLSETKKATVETGGRTAVHEKKQSELQNGPVPVVPILPQQLDKYSALEPSTNGSNGSHSKSMLNDRQNEGRAGMLDAKNMIQRQAYLTADFTLPIIRHRAVRIPKFNLSLDEGETAGDRLAAVYREQRNEVPSSPKKEGSVLSFLAGPDLTSVRGSGQSSFSENIGLAYSHPLVNRLSISVGASYAKKNYKSAYKFYSPANPPQLTQSPSSVSAVCDVIDVPLTANYTVLKGKKVTCNVSAGLSSYFMLKEKYTFDYEGGGNYNGNQRSAVYEIRGENQHIFGVADFSVSIEKKISDKINIGIKPFIKMPLTGIGYGNVDLESKGVAFTLGMGL